MKKIHMKSCVLSMILITVLIVGAFTISANAEIINGRDSKEIDETILNSIEAVEVKISENNFFNYYDLVESGGRIEDNEFYPGLSVSYLLKPEIANRLEEDGSFVEINIEGRYEFAPITSIVWDEGIIIVEDHSDDKYVNFLHEISAINNPEAAEKNYSPGFSVTVSGNKEINIPLNRLADGIWVIGIAEGTHGPISPAKPSDFVEGATWFARVCDLQITSVSGNLRIKPLSKQDESSDYIDNMLAQNSPMDQKATQIIVTTETNTNLGLFTNGQILKQPDYDCVAPFEINAGFGCNYYVYLKYVRDPSSTSVLRHLNSEATPPYEDDISFYVESGKNVEIEVPIGVYKLYYASGDEFFGPETLFGEDTQYAVSDQDITFYGDDQYIHGCSITLYKVVNGNLSTENISEDEFPK